MKIKKATINDVSTISCLLKSNKDDISLFQKTDNEIRKNINDFIIAEIKGCGVACAALHVSDEGIAEVMAVSVLKKYQKSGIGKRLINECIQTAISEKIHVLWLSTAKPSYFSQFGFIPVSKKTLPFIILLGKIKTIFKQPLVRWFPSLFGRYTFMRYAN